jgi:MFS family permease
VGLGGLLGVLWFGSAIGGLVGPPLSGALADGSGGQQATIVLALAATLLATVLTFAVSDRPALIERDRTDPAGDGHPTDHAGSPPVATQEVPAVATQETPPVATQEAPPAADQPLSPSLSSAPRPR